MGEWKERILRELINIKHGYAFKGEFFSEIPNNNLLLTPGNFHIGGGFKDDKFKYYSGNIPNEYILSEGDVIFTMTDLSKAGDTLGYSAKIPRSEKIFLHNQRLGLVEIISEEVDKDFIYWLLRTKSYQKNIVNSCSGSTVKHTSPTKIRDYSFLLPPLEEQKAIASVLSCLDAKIENLRKQNNTLEQIAQTLFKHWFIDFEFPNTDGKPYKSSGGKMQSSVLGDIPVGWEIGTLADEFEIIMGQSPPGSSFNQDHQGMIFFQGRTDFGFRFPTVRLYTIEPNRTAEQFDVLVSVRAPVGDVNVACEKCCIGRGLAAVRTQYKSYCLYKMKSYRKIFDVFENEGTVFGSLNKTNFNFLQSIIPKKTIIDLFESIIFPIDKKVFNNHNQIQTLKNTRDTLLPKLMSGELRVKE